MQCGTRHAIFRFVCAATLRERTLSVYCSKLPVSVALGTGVANGSTRRFRRIVHGGDHPCRIPRARQSLPVCWSEKRGG
jgi:hypothetical protein